MEPKTIAAIATPVASGGVGVVRLSGARSQEVLGRVFRRSPGHQRLEKPADMATIPAAGLASHRFYHGYIVDQARLIDEVLIVLMRAPRSYTGEDVVEIHAHGGPFVLRSILELLIRSGASLAEPGEFTRRAFLNGKIDLTQAEAVADIIAARSTGALNAAVNQASGNLYREISEIRELLGGYLAEMEAAVDFSDQIEAPETLSALVSRLRADVFDPIARLIDCYDRFAWIRSGPTVALVGVPNAGKSTLMNTLLDRERAIVAPTPGTTRDFIEENFFLEGLSVVLTDTAGLRSRATDPVEKIGMERTRTVLARADQVVLVVDAAAGLSEEDEKIMASLDRSKLMVAANKTDLDQAVGFVFPPAWAAAVPVLKISALTGAGVSGLKALLVDRLREQQEICPDEGLVPNLRHKVALEEANQAVTAAVKAIGEGFSEEMVAIDLREAVAALSRIIGDNAGIDLLDTIFSRFCVGK